MRLGHRGVPQRRLAALLALATSLTLSTTPPCAHAAQVPGIVSQADLAAQQAAVQTSGASRQACQVCPQACPCLEGPCTPASTDAQCAHKHIAHAHRHAHLHAHAHALTHTCMHAHT